MKKIILTLVLLTGSISSMACDESVTVGDFAYSSGHKYFSFISAINEDGSVVLKNSNTGNMFVRSDYALMKGCTESLNYCVGDQVRLAGHYYTSVVVGIFGDNDIYVKNTNTGNNFRSSSAAMESRRSGQRVCYRKH